MRPHTVLIGDKVAAARRLAKRQLPTWVISIGDPGEAPPAGLARMPAQQQLRMTFYDAPKGYPGGPTAKHVHSLLNFAAQIAASPMSGVLLVHCFAGISRSTASTIICLAALGVGDELEVCRLVRKTRPKAIPNFALLNHADSILDSSLVEHAQAVFGKLTGGPPWTL